MKDIRLS